MRTVTALLLALFAVSIGVAADGDSQTGTAADFRLAAADLGGLPTERDALVGTVNPLGGIILLGGAGADGPLDEAVGVDPDTNEVTQLPRLPQARSAMAAGTFGGKVYAIGGRVGDTLLKRVDVWEPGSDVWREGPELKRGLADAACVGTTDGLYLIGGHDGKKCRDEILRLQRDKKGNWTWESLGKLKDARRNPGVAVLPDGRLLIVGGRGDDGPLDSCEYFDGKKAKPAPSLPDPCADVIAGVIHYPDASVIVLRGLKGADVQAPLRLNLDLNIWEPRPQWEPLARNGAAGVAWGGRLVAAGGRDHEGKRVSTVRAFGWDAEWKHTLSDEDTADFKDLSISPDGTEFVWGGTTGKLEVRNTATLKLVRSLDVGTVIRSVGWSPDGKRIFYTKGTDKLVLLDAASLEVSREITTPVGKGDDACWSPKGDLIAVASEDSWDVWLFSPSDGSLARTLKGSKNVCTDVAFTADGSRVFAPSKDGKARIWDTQTGEVVAEFAGDGDMLWSGDISADGRLVATGSRKGAVCIYDVASGALLHRVTDTTLSVYTVRFDPAGQFLISGHNKRDEAPHEYEMWSTQTGARLYRFDVKGVPTGQFVEFLPQRNQIFVEAGWRMAVLELVANESDD